MKQTKHTSIAGDWGKVKVDINNGDVLEILTDSTIVSGEFGDRQVFKMKTVNGEKLLSFNQTSLNNLIDAYGDDSSKWVGKQVNVTVIKMNVSGKFRDIIYLYGIGWEMQDDGSVKKVGSGSDDSFKKAEYPNEDIDPENIPF